MGQKNNYIEQLPLRFFVEYTQGNINHFLIQSAMSETNNKHLLDITNSLSDRNERVTKHCTRAVYDMLPITFPSKQNSDSRDCTIIAMQNKHPSLAMYDANLNTESMSYSNFEQLCDPNKERDMLNFLTTQGLIPASQQCLLCGSRSNMHH